MNHGVTQLLMHLLELNCGCGLWKDRRSKYKPLSTHDHLSELHRSPVQHYTVIFKHLAEFQIFCTPCHILHCMCITSSVQSVIQCAPNQNLVQQTWFCTEFAKSFFSYIAHKISNNLLKSHFSLFITLLNAALN